MRACRPPAARRRGPRIPLPLATRVDVGVDVTADHRHRLGARRPDPDQLDVELLTQPPQHRGRPVGAGGDPDRTVGARWRRRSRCRCGTPRRGAGSATAASVMVPRRPAGALPQRDVHRPVVAPGSRTPRCRRPGRRSTPGRRAPATGRRRPPRTAPRRRGRSPRSRSRISVLARLSPASPRS